MAFEKWVGLEDEELQLLEVPFIFIIIYLIELFFSLREAGGAGGRGAAPRFFVRSFVGGALALSTRAGAAGEINIRKPYMP